MPVIIAVLPFALLFGAVAVRNGMSAVEATAMSALIGTPGSSWNAVKAPASQNGTESIRTNPKNRADDRLTLRPRCVTLRVRRAVAATCGP